jgi:hypothetical protein
MIDTSTRRFHVPSVSRAQHQTGVDAIDALINREKQRKSRVASRFVAKQYASREKI